MVVRPWLPRYRHLLGKVVDEVIARKAGVSSVAVLKARRKLGIPARGHHWLQLDEIDAKETLRLIRARARAGKSMLLHQLNCKELSLAERHFGGWYEAVAAAGLKPLRKPNGGAKPKRKERRRPLTEALLRGPKTSAELERLTAVPRTTIVRRRNELGIFPQGRKQAARAWIRSVRSLLGRLPDSEIARLVGKSPQVVARARVELGIPVYRKGRTRKARSA